MAIAPPITYAPGSDNPIPSSSVYDVNGVPTHVSVVNPLPVAVTNGGTASTFVIQLLYQALNGWVDANGTIAISDLLQNITAYDATGTQILDIWVDITQNFTLAAPPPSPAYVTPYSQSGGLTNAQLRASPVPFTTTQLPTTIGQKTSAQSTSVVMASDATAPLPTGAATSALQTTGNTSLSTIANQTTLISGQLPTTLGQKANAASLAVALASDTTLPLPTGAATAANQATEITSLATIATQTTTTATQTTTTATNTGATATNTAAISAQLPPTLGTQLPANSLSVVVANPVSGDTATTSLYQVTTMFTGGNVNDILQAIDFYAPGSPATYISTTWKNLTQGTTLAAAPGIGYIAPITGGGGSASGDVVVSNYFTVKIAAAGYAIGDTLQQVQIIDPVVPSVLSNTWNNVTQGTVLGAAPVLTNLTASNSQLPPALGPQSAANSLSVYVQNPATGSTSVVNTYTVTTGWTDGVQPIAVNDTLQQILIFNSSGTLTSTVWYDVTLSYTLISPPPSYTLITQVTSTSASSANQLTQITEATTTNTNLVAISQQLPLSLGQKAIAGSLSVTSANNYSTYVEQYTAIGTTVNYIPGDILNNVVVLDMNSTAPATIISDTWFNLTQQTQFLGPVASVDLSINTGATAALQTAGNASLTTIATETTAIAGQLPASLGSKLSAASLSTVLASDATLPLPTGAATSANQATEIASLGTIATNTTAISAQLPVALGPQTGANSLSVVVANPTPGDVTVQFNYTAVIGWTGVTIGNLLIRYDIYTASATPVLVSETWFNVNTGATVAAPPDYTYVSASSGSTVTPSLPVVTPTLINATGAGTTTAGATQVSFANTGSGAATIGTATLPPGASLDFTASSGATMASISYDATGTTLLIATLA